MENIKERVLAYGLSTEISESDLHDVTGGAGKLTHYVTHYYTAKKAGGDRERDDDWD
ncbi:hypothetical protein [Legionella brunensis]|uniref:Uncharacterized protein n=1 Tax=Legionella brunensis TaxID=29422 RepID=A0A0W0STE9_9GAMM|nr:hypothetical protein [Legionella brunensis]KTC86667.1 hypothetical protein Lbru_0608 [Legionella brunensis]